MDKDYREIKLANDVADGLNCFVFNDKAFCDAMTKQHRTLQQSFTNLCLEWIKTCGSLDYRYDGRNEMSHYVCKDLIELAEKNDIHLKLPLI